MSAIHSFRLAANEISGFLFQVRRIAKERTMRLIQQTKTPDFAVRNSYIALKCVPPIQNAQSCPWLMPHSNQRSVSYAHSSAAIGSDTISSDT